MENAVPITDPLWAEPIDHQWSPQAKESVMRCVDVFSVVIPYKLLNNSQVADEFTRHDILAESR